MNKALSSNIAYCIVASNSMFDQPDDGLKRPKHVVALKVRYVNKTLSNNIAYCIVASNSMFD